jgi:hypothetical protein
MMRSPLHALFGWLLRLIRLGKTAFEYPRPTTFVLGDDTQYFSSAKRSSSESARRFLP